MSIEDHVKIFTALVGGLTCTFLVFNPFTIYADVITPTYAAPYYSYSHYMGNAPSYTVQGAIYNWWAAYKAYWHAPHCYYDLTLLQDGPITGCFAFMLLRGGCSGNDEILGTPYCPAGYELIKNNQCQSALENSFGQPEQCY